MNILIVDEASVRRAISRILTANDPDEEYKIQEVDLGEEALALLNASAIDLLITGRELPTMKGIELITEVQKKFPNTKIILFSGRVGNIPPGVVFAAKPDVQSLARKVRRIKKSILG